MCFSINKRILVNRKEHSRNSINKRGILKLLACHVRALKRLFVVVGLKKQEEEANVSFIDQIQKFHNKMYKMYTDIIKEKYHNFIYVYINSIFLRDILFI